MKTVVTVRSDGRKPTVEAAPEEWGEFVRVMREREREREERARERVRADVRDAVALAFDALTWLSRFEV